VRRSSSSQQRPLSPLFVYMETGDWKNAADRARKHPREVKTWASLRTKSTSTSSGNKISSAQRLALHHACFKLRNSIANTQQLASGDSEDPFIQVCEFILLLLEIYPEAAGQRESRHGCLPIHLAAFASCTMPSAKSSGGGSSSDYEGEDQNDYSSEFASLSLTSSAPSSLARPGAIKINERTTSESTTDTVRTNMTNVLAEEDYTGSQTVVQQQKQRAAASRLATHHHRRSSSITSVSENISGDPNSKTVSVSMSTNIFVSEKRERYVLKVLNALLDAFPKGIRMDSEGGRLPLHTACAGRATPRVITTLLTAYQAAARHRNKDGFLPLHLCAHWGISHPDVVVSLLKVYPDATFGRNRWERTPLEEALCMAGENGRLHQEALVRALRRHPTYWSKPSDLLLETTVPSPTKRTSQIVDMDASIPSYEEDSADDHGLNQRAPGEAIEVTESGKVRMSIFRKGKKGEQESYEVSDLPELIRVENWSAVLTLLQAKPEAAQVELKVPTRGGFTSSTGFFPLHYALERTPPDEVVIALLQACVQAITARTMPGGMVPLHIACTWHATVNTVNLLLQADKTMAKAADELGNYPLHSACFSGASIPVVESLLRAYPKAVLVRNSQGSLPEDVQNRLRHSNKRAVSGVLSVCKEELFVKKQQKMKSRASPSSLGQQIMPSSDHNKIPETQNATNREQVVVDSADAVEVGLNDGIDESSGLMWV
jgi:hypothetical protein